MQWKRVMAGGWFVGLWALLGACASTHPYSFGREYAPLSVEEDYLERQAPLSYEEVRRDPAGHRADLLGWFGTVVEVKPGVVVTTVALDLRFHQPRHLCSDESEESCRVTVSERDGGPFSVRLRLHPEDRAGRARLAPGSLIKVYGRVVDEFDDRGGPVLEAIYYRHFPTGTYVISSHTGQMRMRR